LVTDTCLDDFGLSVTCVDQDEQKINLFNSGGVPIYEPNLTSLIEKNVSTSRLGFTADTKRAVIQSKVIFIAVGTPPKDDVSANLKQIERVAQQIAQYLNEYKVILEPSFNKNKKLLKTPILLDLRNLYDPEKVKIISFTYK